MEKAKCYSVVKFAAILLIAIICCFIGYTLFVLKHHAWLTLAPIKVDEIAEYVEEFRVEAGYYPKTLTDIVTNIDYSQSGKLKSVLMQTNSFLYDYQVVSNGFVITTFTPPKSLRIHGKFIKYYKCKRPETVLEK